MQKTTSNPTKFSPTAWLIADTHSPDSAFEATLRNHLQHTFEQTSKPWYQRFSPKYAGVVVSLFGLLIVLIGGSHWQNHREVIALNDQESRLEQEITITAHEVDSSYSELDQLLEAWEKTP